MISDPIDDVTKACEDAESEAAKLQIDFAVIMVNYAIDNRDAFPLYAGKYCITAIVNLSDVMFHGWNLIAIATPSGIVYLWSDVPGYERNK